MRERECESGCESGSVRAGERVCVSGSVRVGKND
ncbi:MAG: hypothetical protein MW690_000122 [Methanophagales archaeon]|nr:hypothetical protein [Methanophagales archaeon]